MNNLLISISIGIVALAFLGLVIFLIITLLSLRRTMVQFNEKMHAFDPLFRLVEHSCESLETRSCSCTACRCSGHEETRTERRVHAVTEIVEWVSVGLALWRRFQEKR